MQHYHYIFTGSGLSALMTIYEMILSENFRDKTILLLDSSPKKKNDRTWCFWDDSILFDEIIATKWDSAQFANAHSQRKLELYPYQYKMVRGSAFYNLVFDMISKEKNISFLNHKVVNFEELESHCLVKTDVESYTCNKIFNSIYNPELVKSQTKFPLLQQHFIGWFIKSKEAVFNSESATFMDFSVEQRGNTRFMYVLPTSSNEALLEYTLFSREVLPKEEYEAEIQNYIHKLGITNYEILEKEQGNIPMTSYKFWKHNTKNIIHIGSVGGWTKASSGYTFKNVTKKSKSLSTFLLTENDFRKYHKMDKFWFYDLLFVDVLYKNNELGAKVFSDLFKKGNPTLIFEFLDGETTLWQDLQVIWKCPKGPFINALLRRMLKG